MNDRAIGLLEQYDIDLQRTRKGRGAYLLETDKGLLIFKEYTGNVEKLITQKALLEALAKEGNVQVEQLMATKEDQLFVRDGEGCNYILKTYREAGECDIRNKEEREAAAKALARLHLGMEFYFRPSAEGAVYPLTFEFEKRNRSLKHVQKFLWHKSQKNEFEIRLIESYDRFLKQAYDATKMAYELQTGMPPASFCHGDYQHHNILKTEDGWFIINFEKCRKDDASRDLYLYLRKLSEKTGWSITAGREVLNAYENERPLPAKSRENLYLRLYYPEKFWKIVNFYYNSPKTWLPEKTIEKLEKIISQEKAKCLFLEEMFERQKG